MLYIGAAIENSAFHTQLEKTKAAGEPVWEMPVALDDQFVRPAARPRPAIRRGRPTTAR
jgi:hypothetical protein